MDLYLLDEQLRRVELIDDFESLIWTERFKEVGDFQLVIRSTRGVRALFPVGARVAILKSKRVMVVETVEDTVNDEGVATLTISGPSLESILEDRTNTNPFIWLGNAIPSFVVGPDTPGDIIRWLFDSICRGNPEVPQDNIPLLVPGSLYSPGTIPEPSDLISMNLDFGTLLDTIKNIADIYDLGFRLYRGPDTGKLYFDVYTGNDRTTLQTTNSPVVFSPSLDNLSDTTALTSTDDIKNVAYVNAKNASMVVYADGVDPSISGFSRRVLVVNASDLDMEAGTELNDAMIQRGKEELLKHRPLIAFDGEIPQTGSYQYEVDYWLGDLVEMRNEDGLATNMRVTEQIFVQDEQGERSYPTLAIDLLITPGSWYAWDAGEVWDDADGYWADA